MSGRLLDSDGGVVNGGCGERFDQATATIRKLRADRTVMLGALRRIADGGPVREPVRPGRDDPTAMERYHYQLGLHECALIARSVIDEVTSPAAGVR